MLDKNISPHPFTTTSSLPNQTQEQHHQHQRRYWDQSGISVALTDSKPSHTTTRTSTIAKLVLFGSHQLRIQIPPQPTSLPPPQLTPNSPVEFGIKTPRSHLTRLDSTGSETEERTMMRKSVSMEMMSEDYTCVISRGPNPKTTHIFGNRVVECRSCGGKEMEEEEEGFGLEERISCLDCVSSSPSSFGGGSLEETVIGKEF